MNVLPRWTTLGQLSALMLTLFVIGVPAAAADLPNTAQTFSTAKRWLYERVYADHRLTFYCGCRYNEDRQVDLESCGVTPRKNPERARRVEAEHVFPAYQFGNFRRCWREPEKVCGEAISGRKCCEQTDPVFIAAHNDLHNLFPAVGEINGDRSNYNWGRIPGEKRAYGTCNIEVDPSIRRAEPPENVMGDIARVHFYMEATYGFRLSDQDRKLYTAWDKQDPPDAWEIERNRRIAETQGKSNPFINQWAGSAPPDGQPGFACGDKRTCGEMTSCAEARFHLEQCGLTRLDGNHNGVPCERLCR